MGHAETYKVINPLPWMCIGDFNEVLYQHEHEGTAERSMARIECFRDAIDVCELADLGFEGRWWTYEKCVVGGSFCRVRLDRDLATAAWSGLFPLARVSHLTGVASDHCPIMLRWKETANERRRTDDKIFRYEVMWESHENFKLFLNDVWKADGKAETMGQLQQKLTKVSGSLGGWGKTTFGSVKVEIQALCERVSALRADPLRLGPSEEETRITQRLLELYQREEVMWRQRSCVQWLAEGDKNTRFFHLRASQRKKRNKISQLKREDGPITSDDQEMANMTRDFYNKLYLSEGVSDMEEVVGERATQNKKNSSA